MLFTFPRWERLEQECIRLTKALNKAHRLHRGEPQAQKRLQDCRTKMLKLELRLGLAGVRRSFSRRSAKPGRTNGTRVNTMDLFLSHRQSEEGAAA